MPDDILRVQSLRVAFRTDQGVLRAVDDVSFSVPRGSIVGLVGESGCGKSVTALSILRLVSSPGWIESGSILLDGENLLRKSESEMRSLRGNAISMIFQEPMTSLNPVYTVGFQIVEALRVHQKLKKAEAYRKAIELLREVGIPAPELRVRSYPHQLSGGMRQRVMIAIALACEPRFLIADEPTTALDVTIQVQILELLKSLQQKRNMSVLLITHDLGIVAEFVDYVVVMYAGKVAEQASTRQLFEQPLHPYTAGLLSSVPGHRDNLEAKRLPTIEGVVPDLLELPKGCRFRDRCKFAIERCAEAEPPLFGKPDSAHRAACYVAAQDKGLVA